MTKNKPVVLHVISSLKVGGAEHVLCDLVGQLKKNYSNYVAYMHDGPMLEVLHKHEVKTFKVGGFLHTYDPSMLLRLMFVIWKCKPDIIHSSLWMANIVTAVLGKLFLIPTIVTLHNNLDQDGKLRNFLSRLTLPLASCVIAVSDEVCNGARKFIKKADKLLVIKNGINTTQLHQKAKDNVDLKKKYGLNDSNFIIGSVGRFELVKNYPLLIFAFSKLAQKHSQARLVLVGAGSQEHVLKKLVKEKKIKNKVVFVVGQPAVKYFSIFDCFSLSSNKEGISIALLEAMSFGLPCVITNSASTHDVIKNDINGIIVDAGSEEGLIDAFEQLILDQRKGVSLGENAKKTVEDKFNLNFIVNNYKKAYEKYTNRR